MKTYLNLQSTEKRIQKVEIESRTSQRQDFSRSNFKYARRSSTNLHLEQA